MSDAEHLAEVRRWLRYAEDDRVRGEAWPGTRVCPHVRPAGLLSKRQRRPDSSVLHWGARKLRDPLVK
ncbi:MAG: hypothetical protein QME70_04360 [Bacillota bacterium]|nr:hypothetical protein [Bacillota bacterium]